MFTNFGEFIHWQFWAHIESWSMLWRGAMITVKNTSWWKKSYCKPKGVLCLTGDDLLVKWCTWENNGLCSRSAGSSIQCFRIYPIQWGAGVQSSTASLVHQCSSRSQVDFPSRFSGNLPEAALVVWHWWGKSHHQKCHQSVSHKKGVSQKGLFQGTLCRCFFLFAMVDVNVSKVNAGGSQILRHLP